MANSSGNAQENSTLKRPWVSCHAYHDQDCVPDKQVDPVVTSPLPKKTRSVPDLEQLSENRAVESEPLQVQALANRSDRPAVSGTGAPASGIDDGEKKVLTSIIERSGKTDTTQAFVNDGYQDKEPPDSNEEPEPSPEDVAEDIRFVVGEVDTVDDVDEQEADNVSEISGLSGLSIEGSGWRPMAGPLSWVQNQMKRGADPRRLLRQLIPNDMMLPSDLDNLMLWKIIINILSEPPKRKKLPDFQTIADVVDLIQKCSNILVLTGAGVSVSCGIPDFRSRDGIYARLAEEYPDLPDPQAMFDIHYFRRNPKPFFKFAKEIYPGQFEPSRSHRFIRLIEEHRKLLRNYTQNIDTLEQVAGINNVIQCHGSFATATCMVCRFREDAEAIRQDVMNQVVPRCPCCPDEESLAIMKPDIVFFGEGLPEEFHNQMEQDKDQCDLLIVIGSSLKVRPVALIPNSLPPNVPQILINREPLKHLNFDVELLGDCDIIVNELCHRLADSWSSCCRTGLPAVEISREDMVTPVGSLQGSSMGDTPMPASEENSCSSFQLASVTDRHTPVTQEDSDSGVVTTTSSSHTPSRQLQHDDGRGQSASRTSDSVVSSSGLSQSDSSSRLSFDDLEGTSKEVSKYPASAIGGAMLSSCTSASEDRQLLSTCSDDAAASTSELNGAVLASSSSSVLVDGELHCTSSGHTSASRFTLSGTLPTSTVVDEQDMHTVNTAPAATSMHGAETPPSAGADKTEHPVNTVLAATSSSECDSSSKEKPSMDEGATTPPTYSNVESTVSSTDNDLKELRACWQPKLVNLASRLKEDTFLFLPPSRYVFMGAEVYEGNEESDDDDDDDEGQDNTSTFSSNLSVDYDDVDDAPMDSPSGSSIADASPTEEDSHQDQAVFAAEADAAASDSAEVLTAAEPCTDVTSSSCRSITHSLDTDKPVNSGSSAGGLGPGPEPGPASQEV